MSEIPSTEFSIYSHYDGYDNIDCIYMYDTQFSYKKKIQNGYYIGVYTVDEYDDDGNIELLMDSSVDIKTFYNFKYNDILEYFNENRLSEFHNNFTTIEIMKLDISDNDVYNVISKTHWLRLVQRVWKRVFAERCRILNNRKSLRSLSSREINTKRNSVLPGLNGMLSKLKKSFIKT